MGQKSENQILKDLAAIESNMYQNPVDAKWRLQNMINNHPNLPDSTKALIYLKWSTSLGMTHNIDSAIWAINKGYQLSPDDKIEKAATLRILGILYRLKGNYKEAEKALNESLRLNKQIWQDPMHDAITLQEFGSLCLDQYKYAAAIQLFLQALHPLFTQTLLKSFPKLSLADVQFCTLLRMNLTTKEVSLLLHIEPRSIYRKKYRIMEKMGLNENDDFEKILFEFT